MSEQLRAGAAWYASQGWSVLPCWGLTATGKCGCGRAHEDPKDSGKHPHSGLAPRGLTEATTDPRVVAHWWRTDPLANVAVAAKPSGFVVLDVDPRSGGDASLLALEREMGRELPETVTALTGRYAGTGGSGSVRGRHFFFRVEDGESLKGNLKRDGFPGLDVKHDGYVLVAPSRHSSGETYEWLFGHAPWEIAVAAAPEELLRVIRKRTRVAGSLGWGTDLEWKGERIDVDALAREGVGAGERNNTVLRVACSVANKLGVTKESDAIKEGAVRAYLREFNAVAVAPPLSDEELDKVISNAIEQVAASPAYEKVAPWLSGFMAEGGAAFVERPVAGAPGRTRELRVMSGSGGSGGDETGPAVSLPDDPDVVADDGSVVRRTLSDLGNGRRLVDVWGRRMRYTPSLGWFVWNGEYWEPDAKSGRVAELAKTLPQVIGAEAVSLAVVNPDLADKTVKWAADTRSAGRRANAVADAATDPRVVVGVDTWDANPHLLGVRNGVVDLRTGDLLSGRADLYITRRGNVAYTPGLRNMRWESFLDFATDGDKEMAEWLQRAAGYTLTGDRTFDVLFLVYGPPGSGKSTFLETLIHMLGDYQFGMSSSVLVDDGSKTGGTDDYHWAQLRGRRMVSISELPESRRTKEDAIKRLTGDTSITGRNPGEQPFQFESQAKIWIATNAKPQVEDPAMWRRIRAIPFLSVPERSDPDLKPYLMDPEGGLPAALAWAVEGAVKLLGSGERDALGWCDAVARASAEYRASEDRIGIFLSEETVLGEGASAPMKHVYEVYKSWCEDRGEKPRSLVNFAKRIAERGEKVRGVGARSVLEGRSVKPREVTWAGLYDAGSASASRF